MIDPIEQYLREQSQEGRTDSVGAFTISADKAVAKLAEYQLPRTSAWLLKMVQAGVLARCTSMAITQSGKSSKVCYIGGNLGAFSDLLQAISNPQTLLTPAQQHLMLGLRTVALGRERPVLIYDEPTDSEPVRAFWNHTRVSQPQTIGVLNRSLITHNERRLTFHVGDSPLADDFRYKREKGVRRGVADEYRELMLNAVPCPIPLTVDRRQVDHFGLKDVSLQRHPVLFGLERSETDGEGFYVSPSMGLEANNEGPYSAGWVAYLTQKRHDNEICWVKDGVVCESQTFAGDGPFYLRLFLSAQDVPTDLTGLQLRFKNLADREQRIREALKAFVESSPAITTEKALPYRSNLTPGQSGGWWGAALLAIGGVFLLPFTGGVSAVGGVLGVLGIAVSERSNQAEYERTLRTMFREWAGKVPATVGSQAHVQVSRHAPPKG